MAQTQKSSRDLNKKPHPRENKKSQITATEKDAEELQAQKVKSD